MILTCTCIDQELFRPNNSDSSNDHASSVEFALLASSEDVVSSKDLASSNDDFASSRDSCFVQTFTSSNNDLKGKPGQNWEIASDENQKDEDMSQGYSFAETTSDKENKSEPQINDLVIDKVDTHLDQAMLNESNNLEQDDSSDEGWQEAIPKSRSLIGRKYRSKATNFSSPRTNLNETITGPSSPVPEKYVKSESFSPKPISNNVSDAGAEKLADSKSAPTSPVPGISGIVFSQQHTRTLLRRSSSSASRHERVFSCRLDSNAQFRREFGYTKRGKETHLAQESHDLVLGLRWARTTVETEVVHRREFKVVEQRNLVLGLAVGAIVVTTTNDVEDYAQKSLDEKRLSPVHEEQKEKETAVVKDNPETVNSKVSDEVIEIRLQEANNVAIIEKRMEVGNIKDVEIENSGCLDKTNNGVPKGAIEIQVHESFLATSHNLNRLTILVEDKKQLFVSDASVSKDKVAEGDGKHESSGDNAVTAPPFNPSTIPVFGSVPIPGFKDHGGILPPPVNISPLLPVGSRRSPHRSTIAKVPYGPRISGSYNRYGNRVPWNKTVFHSGEPSPDGIPSSPPRIMNPHATEFVLDQHWVPNGYVVPPNGYMASPNAFPVSPNSFPPV
ncbi:hypothetical protein Fmac_026584 [Flemingia macrophylla]|uniref:Uncharacterized protein n=1 Tax=Flemingia macrophylla TaxID=520843 RepID=A0ABD1LGZ6_9FABA